MRSWFLLSIALTAAVVASWFHRTAPARMPRLSIPCFGLQTIGRSGRNGIAKRRHHGAGSTTFLKPNGSGYSRQPRWRCGMLKLSGQCCQRGGRSNLGEEVGCAGLRWRSNGGAQPGEMSQHWREGEAGATLMRTEFGWALKSDGWVVWKDTTQERHFERPVEVPLLPRRVPTSRRFGGLDKVGRHPWLPRRWRKHFGTAASSCPLGPRDGLMAEDGPSRIPILGVTTLTHWRPQTTGQCFGRTNRWW